MIMIVWFSVLQFCVLVFLLPFFVCYWLPVSFFFKSHVRHKLIEWLIDLLCVLHGRRLTDYACQIFHDALLTGHHECFLRADTRLPMMYIDDCIRSITEYMVVPDDQLRLRTYNVHAMSFTPYEIAQAIRCYVPELTITYKPDSRQKIGESPQSIYATDLLLWTKTIYSLYCYDNLFKEITNSFYNR